MRPNREDPEPSEPGRQTGPLRQKRVGDPVAIRFGLEEDGDGFSVIVEAAALLCMTPVEFVREFSLYHAQRIIRRKRRRAS